VIQQFLLQFAEGFPVQQARGLLEFISLRQRRVRVSITTMAGWVGST
jgi:hypothetical protein